MSANRTHRLIWSAALLVASSVAGCAPPPGDEPTTPRQVRRELTQEFKRRDPPLLLEDLRDEGEGHYTGKAEANLGGEIYTYTIAVTVEGRWMRYSAKGSSSLAGEGPVLSGILPVPPPTFRERHFELMQWLRAVAFVVQGLTVVWTVLGRFGLRRLYSTRAERVLVIVAAVNLGFALLWGYEFITNLRGE